VIGKRLLKKLALGMLLVPMAACSESESEWEPERATVAAPSFESFAAPDFSLARLGGGEVSRADLEGKIVILDFWATWCAPCEKSIPVLNAFFDAHRASGIEVYGVSTDVDGEEIVAPWIAERDVRYPILIGDFDLAQRFGAPGLPVSFLIAPDGNVIDRHIGFLEVADLEHSLALARSYRSAVQRPAGS